MKKLVALLVVGGVGAGCTAQSIEANRINLATYSPAVDYEGQGISFEKYQKDIGACRLIALKVQGEYEQRRKEESERAVQSAVAGALIGAVAGAAIGDTQGNARRGALAGAGYGGAIGAAAGAEAVDHTRLIARFGPTKVVDRCMQNRGYALLSELGLGGG